MAGEVFRRVDPAITFTPLVADGDAVAAMTPIATVEGPARSLLAGGAGRAEPVAASLRRGHRSPRATSPRCAARRRASSTPARRRPGLRALEKAAVRHGGGHNHRFGLTDGVLIKDNHLAAVGGADRVARAVALARQGAPHTLRIEIEVTTLDELAQALEAGADIVLLDNMEVAALREAVAMTAGRALLEASGGVTLETRRRDRRDRGRSHLGRRADPLRARARHQPRSRPRGDAADIRRATNFDRRMICAKKARKFGTLVPNPLLRRHIRCTYCHRGLR